MPRDDRFHDLSPLFDDDEDIGIGVAHGRRSSSYYRLPDPLLRLSVLKLDGSSFDVQVARTGTVRELKLAVEGVFKQPMEAGLEISWSHVWSNFCLSYRDENLIHDDVTLRSLRVHDGDQLRFVKHHLANYGSFKRQHSIKGTILLKNHRRTMTAPDILVKYEGNAMRKSHEMIRHSRFADEKCHNYEENEVLVGHKQENEVLAGHKQENEVLVGQREFKFSHFLLGLFSCTGAGTTDSEVRTP